MSRSIAGCAAAALLLWAAPAAGADPVQVDFEFEPVAGIQAAIWIEDTSGTHVMDVFVTDAVGRHGIGNRPGEWNWLSGYRFPYGARASVLPVWAHRRGTTYPKIVFHDDDVADQDSMGWHEGASSDDDYFCRPMTAAEHHVAVDTMTCPTVPALIDKGKLDPAATSVYPPRSDLAVFTANDSPDAPTYADLNDLDAISAPTPPGGTVHTVTIELDLDAVGTGPLVAFIEVSLEDDQNQSYSFDRDLDHHVDQRLIDYGLGFLGQPSVVYRNQFDPAHPATYSSSGYFGYGEPDGSSGTLHPPDASISTEPGSGAGRLRPMAGNATFAVTVHEPAADDTTGTTAATTDDGDDGNATDQPTSGPHTGTSSGGQADDTRGCSCSPARPANVGPLALVCLLGFTRRRAPTALR